jgi:NAD(P)-dependent dehydrogenase (short-subunit alcohol dehydrogenase family)
MSYAGKIVLVTGAQQGIGRAMALEFAAAGADIAVNWLDDEGAAQGVAEGVRVPGVPGPGQCRADRRGEGDGRRGRARARTH